jgi:hypothetical protein
MRREGLHHASSNWRTVRAHGPSRSASRGHHSGWQSVFPFDSLNRPDTALTGIHRLILPSGRKTALSYTFCSFECQARSVSDLPTLRSFTRSASQRHSEVMGLGRVVNSLQRLARIVGYGSIFLRPFQRFENGLAVTYSNTRTETDLRNTSHGRSHQHQ